MALGFPAVEDAGPGEGRAAAAGVGDKAPELVLEASVNVAGTGGIAHLAHGSTVVVGPRRLRLERWLLSRLLGRGTG